MLEKYPYISNIYHDYLIAASENQPFLVGFFSPVRPSVGAGLGLAATDAAAPDSAVSGGFPFSVSAHSLFLQWADYLQRLENGLPVKVLELPKRIA